VSMAISMSPAPPWITDFCVEAFTRLSFKMSWLLYLA
jgi:hypothetical protein